MFPTFNYTTIDGKKVNLGAYSDRYDGKRVTQLGGYFGRGVPTPFLISVEELYINSAAGSKYGGAYYGDIEDFNITDEYCVEELIFVLNIGKNLRTVKNVEMDVYFPHVNEDGSYECIVI